MKKVTVELEVWNKFTDMPGTYSVDADVNGENVEFDWSSGAVFWQGNDGEDYGPYEYEPRKIEEERLIDLAINSADGF